MTLPDGAFIMDVRRLKLLCTQGQGAGWSVLDAARNVPVTIRCPSGDLSLFLCGISRCFLSMRHDVGIVPGAGSRSNASHGRKAKAILRPAMPGFLRDGQKDPARLRADHLSPGRRHRDFFTVKGKTSRLWIRYNHYQHLRDTMPQDSSD